MTERLREFIEAHPGGWNHEEWMDLLSDLGAAGVDVSEPQEIGEELERARLIWELRRRSVTGLGPKRIETLAKRFGTVWTLRHASVDEVARVPSMNRPLAENVLSALS